MKILITGGSGFVASYYLELLEQIGDSFEVILVDRQFGSMREYSGIKVTSLCLNLIDGTAVEDLLLSFRPNFILHLASFSSVGQSWQNPVECFSNNTNIFLILVDVIRRHKLVCRVLSVGSSEEYGLVDSSALPLIELTPAIPSSPYAVARLAQEQLSKVYVDGYGLDIVMTRSFNHIGARQRPDFVIPSIAKKLVSMKKSSGIRTELLVGDISVIRDFSDVRDVVRAYYLLMLKGEPGEVYNVCSGIGYSIKDITAMMSSRLDMEVDCKIDPSLLRPVENPIIIGSNSKLVNTTCWQPEFTIENSIDAVLNYWIDNLPVD